MAYKDFRVTLTKSQITAILKKAKLYTVYKTNDWKYPNAESNNGNNAFMQMSFEVEKQSGTMVWIPDNKPEGPAQKIPAFGHNDMAGLIGNKKV